MATERLAGFSQKIRSLSLLRESSYFSLLFMDAIWSGLCFYLLASPSASYWIVLLFFLVGILLSHTLTRLLNYYDIKPTYRKAAVLIWIIVFLILSRQFLITTDGWVDLNSKFTLFGEDSNGSNYMTAFYRVLIPLIVFARGLYIARNQVDLPFFQTNFKLSLILLGIGGFFYKGPQLWIILTLILFMMAGLTGSILTRIYNLGTQRGAKVPPINRMHFSGILLSVSLILGGGVLLGWLLGYQFGELSQTVIKTITTAIFIIVGILVSPILLGLLFLFEKLALLIPEQVDIPTPSETGSQLLNDLKNLAGPENPAVENLFDVGVMVILGTILLAILVGIFLSIRWSRSMVPIRMEEGMSSLDLQNEPQRQGRFDLLRNFIGFRNIRKRYYASRIRAIYAHLLELAAELGIQRNPAITPLEFMPVICTHLTYCQKEIQLITRSYVKIRYGELPESEEEFKLINEAWEVVKELVRNQKKK